MELYDSMVGKEGTEGEQEAKNAYKAARKESDGAIEVAIGDKVSSALVDRVTLWPSFFLILMLLYNWKTKEQSRSSVNC